MDVKSTKHGTSEPAKNANYSYPLCNYSYEPDLNTYYPAFRLFVYASYHELWNDSIICDLNYILSNKSCLITYT